jgi:hypothetical protein
METISTDENSSEGSGLTDEPLSLNGVAHKFYKKLCSGNPLTDSPDTSWSLAQLME